MPQLSSYFSLLQQKEVAQRNLLSPLVQGGAPQSFTNHTPPLCNGGFHTAGVTGGLFR